MHSHLTARRNDPFELGKELVNIVLAGAQRGSRPIRCATWIILAGYHKKRRAMAGLYFQVPVKFEPKIPCDPKVHKWQEASGPAVPQ